MSTYVCPMHPAVRETAAANCPICGMSLVPEDTRFPMLKHMASRPLHVAIMLAAIAAVTAAAMLLLR